MLMGYRLRFEIIQSKHAKRVAKKPYVSSDTVPCEQIERATWDRMANAFKAFAYCNGCGFNCEAKNK